MDLHALRIDLLHQSAHVRAADADGRHPRRQLLGDSRHDARVGVEWMLLGLVEGLLVHRPLPDYTITCFLL